MTSKRSKKEAVRKAGKEKLRILLLEGIHPVAVENFQKKGFTDIEIRTGSLSDEELLEIIPDVHMIGIRSKTKIRQHILDAAQQLLAVGCFCIGTDQVDLKAAAKRGVAVFNAPFSNTRSVAELVIAEVVMLARRAAHRSMQLHSGQWEKSAEGCMEVRRKTIGIVGYGHIGPQVGVLAEAMGMKVVLDAGTMREGSRELVSLVDVLIASKGFAEPLVGPDASPESSLVALRQLCPGDVIITLGSKGSIGCDNGEVMFQKAISVKAVDTTGAGDVYHGAYIYGILQGWGMNECMRFAPVTSGLKCREIGAQEGIPGLDEIKNFLI